MGADQSLIGQHFAAFLFDMDGTILNSIAAAERIWANWATANGLDPQMVLAAVHGVRAVDTIRRFAPAGTDIEAEAHRITLAEIDDVEGIVEVPGACEFLRALPADRWAVVTSAPRTLALRRMAAGGLPIPDVLVTAEDVQRGKPAPDGFLLGAERLGVPITECLVWEDSPAGIAAAHASGASVMAVGTPHTSTTAPAHATVVDYTSLSTVATDGRLQLVDRPS